MPESLKIFLGLFALVGGVSLIILEIAIVSGDDEPPRGPMDGYQ
jgi:hypothetical protein